MFIKNNMHLCTKMAKYVIKYIHKTNRQVTQSTIVINYSIYDCSTYSMNMLQQWS